jgi:hypothetical protein
MKPLSRSSSAFADSLVPPSQSNCWQLPLPSLARPNAGPRLSRAPPPRQDSLRLAFCAARLRLARPPSAACPLRHLGPRHHLRFAPLDRAQSWLIVFFIFFRVSRRGKWVCARSAGQGRSRLVKAGQGWSGRAGVRSLLPACGPFSIRKLYSHARPVSHWYTRRFDVFCTLFLRSFPFTGFWACEFHQGHYFFANEFAQ